MNRKFYFGLGLIAIAALAFAYLRPAPETDRHGASMGLSDSSEMAQGAAIANIVLPDVLSPDARIGKRGFDAKCAQCHGDNAAGKNGLAPPLVHKIYEPNHHSDMAFVLAARNGVRAHHWKFGNMPPVKGVTDADVKSIALYIRELQRENGIF